MSLKFVPSTLGKFFARKDAHALFHGVWTACMKVIEFQWFYEFKKI